MTSTNLKLEILANHSKYSNELDILDGQLFAIERKANTIKTELEILKDALNLLRMDYKHVLTVRNQTSALCRELKNNIDCKNETRN